MANITSQRKDRLIKDKRRDVYKARKKLPELTNCPKCGAFYANGRWVWKSLFKPTNQTICPACRRILEDYPAGCIELRGSFFKEHRNEIMHLIQNIENKEKNRHPLERIMLVTDKNKCTLVKTTGVHIARRICEALSRSYKGEVTFKFARQEKSVRGYWQREK